jgi:hypothetical protein
MFAGDRWQTVAQGARHDLMFRMPASGLRAEVLTVLRRTRLESSVCSVFSLRSSPDS